MNLNVNGAFVYFTIPVLGGIPITQTTVSSFLVTLLLIIACIKLGRGLKTHPSGGQVLVEKGVAMLYGMVEETMGGRVSECQLSFTGICQNCCQNEKTA